MTAPMFASVRSRIFVLAVLTCALLAIAAAGFFYILQNSQLAVLGTAEKHLLGLGAALNREYVKSRLADPASLLDAQAFLRDDDRLSSFTAEVLQREQGIEGGFYSLANDDLRGYAFPTHEGPGGPGGKKDIPAKERPAIQSLAEKAANTGTAQTYRFRGPRDAILFVAVPLTVNDRIVGSSWMMQRMPGIDAGRNLQLFAGSLGFAIAALTCALLAFLITSRVQSGVTTVLEHIGAREKDLASPRTAKPQLAEFQRVLDGVDTLSSSLREKIERERELELKMRHQERLSALGQFAAGMAHELRNPLATIRLRTQMTQSSGQTDAAVRNSSVVLDEVERLDAMIERLLYFARPIQLSLQPVDIGELCGEMQTSWLDRFEKEQVRLCCEVDEEIIVLADRSKLRQVLDNLMANALDAFSQTPLPGREVRIRAWHSEDVVSIEVIDNGQGISPEAKSQAFNPFFTTKERGTGLGLSISYEIIHAHAGGLALSDDPAGGARALIYLPAGGAPTRSGEEQHP